MLRLVPLLARRAAELPRFRVRAQLPHTPGYGADLELEPLAWRDGRAGDIPYDLKPDVVPANDRSPEAGLSSAGADEEGWSDAAQILDRIRESGVQLAESEERALLEIADAIDDPTDYAVDQAMDATLDLVRELSGYDDPAARAIADRMRPQIEHLGTLGWPTMYPLRRPE